MKKLKNKVTNKKELSKVLKSFGLAQNQQSKTKYNKPEK